MAQRNIAQETRFLCTMSVPRNCLLLKQWLRCVLTKRQKSKKSASIDHLNHQRPTLLFCRIVDIFKLTIPSTSLSFLLLLSLLPLVCHVEFWNVMRHFVNNMGGFCFASHSLTTVAWDGTLSILFKKVMPFTLEVLTYVWILCMGIVLFSVCSPEHCTRTYSSLVAWYKRAST